MMNIAVILNPKSANGAAAGLWSRVRQHLPENPEVFETKAPGHGIELTAAAVRNGARTIIAVGGDGTINEVVNGFFDGDNYIAGETTLGIIPHGTGSDFIRTLKLPGDAGTAAGIILRGAARAIDLERVQYTTMDGRAALRYAVNLTSFGMGGAVAAKANRSSKALGGKAAFLAATLTTALRYSGRNVRMVLDGSTILVADITNVAVGNGQYHGSGMWVCPRASMEDGLLDVTTIRRLRLHELVRNLPLLYNGRIYEHSKVSFHRVREILAASIEPTLIEIDGEPLGRLPVRISVAPKAIRVLAP